VGIFKQEYWSGLLFPSPVDLPDTGIEPMSPVSPSLQVDLLPAEPSRKSRKGHINDNNNNNNNKKKLVGVY
jgi:hypothetical protein